MASPPSELLPEIRRELTGLRERVGTWWEIPPGAVWWRVAPAPDALVVLLEGAARLPESPFASGETAPSWSAPGLRLGSCFAETNPPPEALSAVVFCILERTEFLQLSETAPRLRKLLDAFLLGHLAQRERDLRYSRLEQQATLESLVTTQRLAALGQVAASLAHELNNPVAALEQSLADLRPRLLRLLAEADASLAEFFQRSLQQPLVTGEDLRERLETLARAHPQVERPLLRRLAQCDPAALVALPDHAWEGTCADPAPGSPLARLLDLTEMAAALRRLEISGHRVARLVRSVRNHSHPGQDDPEEVDLAVSISETLLVLRGALREIEVTLRLEKLPRVWAPPGPLAQVWTNLLINAAEAMQGQGRILISGTLRQPEANEVEILFEDDGPGVAEHLREQIFTMHFTTKSERGAYGQGIGLALSREIITRQGGQIFCATTPSALGGARFVVRLPLGRTGLPLSQQPQAPQCEQGVNAIKKGQPLAN